MLRLFALCTGSATEVTLLASGTEQQIAPVYFLQNMICARHHMQTLWKCALLKDSEGCHADVEEQWLASKAQGARLLTSTLLSG